MASLVLYLSATVLFAQSTVAFNCSKKPIYVDIHKRAVHDSPVFQYGSFIGLGTPSQNQSLWPSIAQNHTSFASHEYCSNSTLKSCDKSTGGFFNPEDSVSFVKQPSFQTLDRGSDASFSGSFGQESVRLYTHFFETEGASQTLLENSTVEVVTEGSIIPARLGMGSSSTVLRDLAARDMIAGRTYSLYIGQGFNRAGGAVNGSNTFGGYDSGRFTGTPHQYQMNIANVNPMSVRIKDIILTGTNDNSNVSLFDNTAFPEMKSRAADFEAQITTEQFPISLPYQITKNFMARTSAEKDKDNTWGDNSLRVKNSFNGTLSIVLEDGYTITIPSEVLVNASNITPIQERTEDSKAPFYLGSAFLGQVYLMADYEMNTFFLADAVQKNNAVMPVTFCPKSVPEAYQRPSQSQWQRQGLIGAVVGGVVGGMGALAALYCLVVVFYRKKDERKLQKELKKNEKTKMAQFDIEEAPTFDPPPSKVSKARFWKKT
ncbi:acid protease [Ophiobolus disseminans]|uniref:Acid protease n=1 Tax=Ophiobolus disseminans TaxID=1469910 RepID=A0A6A7A2R1_9PLEO|nr:acid protease [Ophiobolus disseminans]